jgi:hypothetical protein
MSKLLIEDLKPLIDEYPNVDLIIYLAKAGIYHDFTGYLTTPKTDLFTICDAYGIKPIADNVMAGKYDDRQKDPIDYLTEYEPTMLSHHFNMIDHARVSLIDEGKEISIIVTINPYAVDEKWDSYRFDLKDAIKAANSLHLFNAVKNLKIICDETKIKSFSISNHNDYIFGIIENFQDLPTETLPAFYNISFIEVRADAPVKLQAEVCFEPAFEQSDIHKFPAWNLESRYLNMLM